MFGRGYSKHLNSLIERGILERIPIGTDKKNGKEYFYSKDAGRCTSYTLNKETIGCLERGEYSRVIVKVPYVYPPKTPALVFSATDKPNPASSQLVTKILDSYRGISISEDWQNQFNVNNPDVSEGSYRHAKLWINQIQKGIITVGISDNGRIHHPLILLQRILRPFVSKDGANLVGIDGKAFHPHLLAKYLPDSKRREYLDFLSNNDIYQQFVDGKNDRDNIKRLFQVFLGSDRVYGKAQEIENWYKEDFSEIIHWKYETLDKHKVSDKNDTVQMTLQKMESKIFINGIFTNADFWCLPIHDGILVKPEDTERAVAFCAQQIYEHLGFNIKVEPKPL
jgi:hypothetical protein